MPEDFRKNEQAESTQSSQKEANADDLALKAENKKNLLGNRADKLNADVDFPANPENTAQYESAQEAQVSLNRNPVLKNALESNDFDRETAARIAEAFAKLSPESIISEKTELSPDETASMEKEIADLAKNVTEENASGMLLGLKPLPM